MSDRMKSLFRHGILEGQDAMASELAEAGIGTSVDNKQWGCERNCGYTGVFDDVAEHEKTCEYRESNAEGQ